MKTGNISLFMIILSPVKFWIWSTMIFKAFQWRKENKTDKALFYRLRYIWSCKYFIWLFGKFQCPYQVIAFRCPNSYRRKLKFFYRLETGGAVKWNKGKKGKKPKQTQNRSQLDIWGFQPRLHYWSCIVRESWSLRLSLQGVIMKAFHVLDVWKGCSEILTC